jgi:(p)ppGpp synthase/HD superfamily hydrolase
MSTFELAISTASVLHAGQVRKGTNIPYITHPLAVAGLVYEYGGDETEACAAVLHDTVEDCGGLATLKMIQKQFGDEVADIVLQCSDSLTSDPEKKGPWKERKLAYLASFPRKSRSAVLVTACDKLHNARTILADVRRARRTTPDGVAGVWNRFQAGYEGTCWYYSEVIRVLIASHCDPMLVGELMRVVGDMRGFKP